MKTILLLRHGHRLAWTLDPSTGNYTSAHPYPTRLPADPPLASHGVTQARETATYLCKLLRDAARRDTLRIYSSLFYRCLETLRPTVEKLREDPHIHDLHVRGERGIGEWFGHAWFEQPSPADPQTLKDKFFPWLNAEYKSHIIPNAHGEWIAELQERVASVLEAIVRSVDAEFEAAGRGDEGVTVLISGHAAQIICSGRALTGNMPEDLNQEDFKCFTCGISKFVRREGKVDTTSKEDGYWTTNGGVAGGWDCVLNSSCAHLSEGEERGWHFHGDESFASYKADAFGQSSAEDRDPKKYEVNDTNEDTTPQPKL